MDMNAPITRAEHEEFRKALVAERDILTAEDKRQNKRLDNLEESVRQINELTISVSRMADSLERMVAVQKEQGKRLEELESVPAKNWNVLKTGILSAIAGVIGTGIVAAIISFIH